MDGQKRTVTSTNEEGRTSENPGHQRGEDPGDDNAIEDGSMEEETIDMPPEIENPPALRHFSAEEELNFYLEQQPSTSTGDWYDNRYGVFTEYQYNMIAGIRGPSLVAVQGYEQPRLVCYPQYLMNFVEKQSFDEDESYDDQQPSTSGENICVVCGKSYKKSWKRRRTLLKCKNCLEKTRDNDEGKSGDLDEDEEDESPNDNADNDDAEYLR